MPLTLHPFHFEQRFLRRLDYLSEIGETLPLEPPRTAPTQIAYVTLDSQSSIDQLSSNQTDPDSPSPLQECNQDRTADFDLTQTAIHHIKCAAGDIRICGNTLLCTCPDCSAPVSIRIWLSLADCWRCATSISLTEEQINAAEQLAGSAVARRSDLTPEPARRSLTDRPDDELEASPANGLPPLSPALIDMRRQELERLTRGSFAARVIRRSYQLTPVWLISFLLHLIAILILALIVLNDGARLPPTITLSTFLSSDREPGGQFRLEDPADLLQDDLELASPMEAGDQELRDVLQAAQQDARELVIDPRPIASMVDITHVKRNITQRPDQLMSFAARDPRVRAEIVHQEGGTTITEAAVARGLRWLASVQNRNGSWSLGEYNQHNRAQNNGDVMGTSLALLPLLGAGQTHEFGVYKDTVAAGLAWLIHNQEANGDLRAGFPGQAGMYAHGQAAIVLCEALALTGDQRFHDPAQRAIQFIELAQHGDGGWRYHPGQAGDTSVFGWQMMALQSARAANLNLTVDESTLKLADYFLDTVTAPERFDDRRRTPLPEGAAYCYQKGREATPAMTAEAILCRMYLGWKRQDPRLNAAVKWLINDHSPNANEKNLYYWYYGTQVMHHYGGKPWQTWNDKMRELLISTQETGGRYPGSWGQKQFEWGNRGGRIYTTSLACCTLEVYYRHLPLFKKIELDE